jgi:hypothetical protein
MKKLILFLILGVCGGCVSTAKKQETTSRNIYQCVRVLMDLGATLPDATKFCVNNFDRDTL